MAYYSMQNFIEILRKNNQIDIIDEFVSPELEICEITDRYCKNNGKAILFKNTGTKFPVLTNSMGSKERICLALNVEDLDDFGKEIRNLFHTFNREHVTLWDKIKIIPKLKQISSWMPKTISGKGVCQEVVMNSPDIEKLPVLKTWPYDGGRFITLPVVHTKDPQTGKRNVGMYRMQIIDEKTCGMHWHRHKGGAKHFEKYKQEGKKMPVAVVLGGDPVYTYAATAPMPDNFDEYLLAGFVRKKPVRLVKCLTQDIEVPEDADFVIEGYIDPAEEFINEGPFGDHTGFYSLQDKYPAFHITAITHRKDAVYPATIVGIPPQEDAWIGKASERIFLAPLQLAILPEIVDISMPVEGVVHNLVIIKIKKEYPGHASKVMNSIWGAGQMMFSKILLVVDDTVDIEDYMEIGRQIIKNVNPETDLLLSSGPVDVLDHAGNKPSLGGKVGIDATTKTFEESTGYNKAKVIDDDGKAIKDNIENAFPEIKKINTSLFEKNINVVFVGIDKNKKNHVSLVHDKLTSMEVAKCLFAVVYTDVEADFNSLDMLIWRCANNYDPKRDTIISGDAGRKILGIDATRKTAKYDDFERPWPNIVVMDEGTINKIDSKWPKFGLENFYPSPSLNFINQRYKGKAVAEE